ncbi:MAG: CCA tRNA nucleotidyltransferase [Halodesulfurarchaeum sp.]
MSSSRVESVLEAVQSEIDPSPADRARLETAVDSLIGRTERVLEDIDVPVSVRHVGSTARSTWVAGDRDIDVFLQFPTDLDRGTLTRLGLQVGNEVLPEGQEEYAEHPYVTGEYDGFDVDLVPCYAVADPADIKSAVDRTPFHNDYLERRLDEDLAGEIRLFKQFLKGVGAYGSDLKTAGYSGYLTELLVLEYGDFLSVLEAARAWRPPVELDPEAHGEASFDDPLVVIDPTDPERNVAAVVSEENVARLIHHARRFLEDPSTDRFFEDPPEGLSPERIREVVRSRASTPIAVRFDPPDLVEDQLYPQLERSLAGLVRGLQTHDFEVLRGDAWANDTAVLFVDLSVSTLPAIERHTGPPVHVSAHAERFFETYDDAPVYGPFIDGDRYVVERDREYTSAVDFVEESLLEVAHGAQLEGVLESGYTTLSGEEIGSLADEFETELARFYDPRP